MAAHPIASTPSKSTAVPSASPVVVDQVNVGTARPPVFVDQSRSEISSSRRLVRSTDFLNPAGGVTKEVLWRDRALASSRLHLALDEVKSQVALIRDIIPTRSLPSQLVGAILQPDGSAAARVQVEVSLPNTARAVHPIATTDQLGEFSVSLPVGETFPTAGIDLNIRGADKAAKVTLKTAEVAPNGLVGNVTLPSTLQPLPSSIMGSLKGLLPAGAPTQPVEAPPPTEVPSIIVGEEGECELTFDCNTSIDRFPFGVFVRLVEPRTSIVSPAIRLFLPGGGNKFFPVTDYFPLSEQNNVDVTYVDRTPVDQPISIDGFRDELVGVGDGTTVSSFETVAMAGTLGLGYVLRLSQQWTPKGLTLGNLVYSLPLAPGEQQRVAVFERRDTSQVFESETLSVQEQQRFQQLTDASTEAVFSSAFSESAKGGSQFSTQADSWGAAGSIIIFSAGGGGSSSSGNSSSWLEGQRDYASRATEDVHTNVQREAAASRRLSRTGMRLASASESAEVTTKVITNHNHTRALTLQYWEVQRLYEIATHVEGVSLICLVPLEVIRFPTCGPAPRVNRYDNCRHASGNSCPVWLDPKARRRAGTMLATALSARAYVASTICIRSNRLVST